MSSRLTGWLDLLVHVYMCTAFSNLARGDDCPLLTQAASYFVDIHTLVLSAICCGDACSLAGRERSPHDTQPGAVPSIPVTGPPPTEPFPLFHPPPPLH